MPEANDLTVGIMALVAQQEELLACALRRWHPGIGDPTLGGWMTVAASAVAALLALGVLLRIAPSRPTARIESRFWAAARLLEGREPERGMKGV